MKKLFLTLLLALMWHVPAHADVLLFSPDGTYANLADLAAASTYAGAAGATIVVTTPQTLTANLNWPQDRNLKIELGGGIDTNGYTLTINGRLSAGLYKVFSGSGSVVFGSGSIVEAYPEWFGTGAAAAQKAVNASKHVRWTADHYSYNDTITLNSNNHITLQSNVKITQNATDKPIFRAIQKDNVWIHANGAVLYGKGSWSPAWSGNSGHEDHGIQFKGCTRSGIVAPTIKNMAHAGIAIIGGDGIRVVSPRIEGTHTYSTPLPYQANFQNGIYITNDVTYGKADNIVIIGADISGVAQGILREAQVGGDIADVGTTIISPNIHAIPGQHAVYIQSGKVSISNAMLSDIALSGIKIQSGDANQDISGFSATGVVASNVRSQLFEVATSPSFNGSLRNIILSGVGTNVGRGLSIYGPVSNLKADLVLSDTSDCGVQMQGHDIHDVEITINGRDIGTDGVFIFATDSDGIRIRPTLRNCNTSATANAAPSGIRVQSASTQVDLFDPNISDDNNRMYYGIFNSVAGSTIRVHGSVHITGAKDTAVRATGVISEWPTEVTLQGTNGDFTAVANVRSSHAMMSKLATTSTTNAVLWGRSLEPASTYRITAEITGMKPGSNERKNVRSTILAYRNNAGAAKIQGAQMDSESMTSAGFAGKFSWTVDGDQVVLLVNSGGTSTYKWKAGVTAIQLQ